MFNFIKNEYYDEDYNKRHKEFFFVEFVLLKIPDIHLLEKMVKKLAHL
jgi:hypothetical protein